MIDIAAVLAVLNFQPLELVAICHQRPGGIFASDVVRPDEAAALVAEYAQYGDVWFGVNPVAGPPRRNAGRGTAASVTRLAGLFADLDVKPSGMPTFDAARAVIEDLAAMLGADASDLTLSG